MELSATQLEKLKDYIDGLKSLSGSSALPVGLIIDDGIESKVEQVLESEGVKIIVAAGHPDLAIKEILTALESGAGAALSIPAMAEKIDSKIYNFLSGLAQGNVSVHLAGEVEPRNLEGPLKGYLVLVASAKFYDEAGEVMNLGAIISSVCRL